MAYARLIAVACVLAIAPSAFAGDCKTFGGVGNGLTEDIAKFMADAAVRNIIENKGLKPTGEATHSCKAATIGSECSARQQGCK